MTLPIRKCFFQKLASPPNVCEAVPVVVDVGGYMRWNDRARSEGYSGLRIRVLAYLPRVGRLLGAAYTLAGASSAEFGRSSPRAQGKPPTAAASPRSWVTRQTVHHGETRGYLEGPRRGRCRVCSGGGCGAVAAGQASLPGTLPQTSLTVRTRPTAALARRAFQSRRRPALRRRRGIGSPLPPAGLWRPRA